MWGGRGAVAQTRIGILPVDGPAGEKFQTAMEQMAEELGRVMPRRRLAAKLRKIRRFRVKRAHIRKLARLSNVDVILAGKSTKRPRGRYRLRLQVYAADGEELGPQVSFVSRKGRLDRRQKEKLQSHLEESLAELNGGEGPIGVDEDDLRDDDFGDDDDDDFGDDDDDDDDFGDDDDDFGDDDDDFGDDDDDDDDFGDDDDDDDELEGEASPKLTRTRPVDGFAGMSFSKRSLSFAFNRQLPTDPQGYSSGSLPVPGLYIDANVYPMAFNAKRKGVRPQPRRQPPRGLCALHQESGCRSDLPNHNVALRSGTSLSPQP